MTPALLTTAVPYAERGATIIPLVSKGPACRSRGGPPTPQMPQQGGVGAHSEKRPYLDPAAPGAPVAGVGCAEDCLKSCVRAMIAPMEGVYDDQEGHTSSVFERALPGGGIDCLFDELKKALTQGF